MKGIGCLAASDHAARLPVGRFAPSPTGDLHMGSLMAAVASYLAARCVGGRWLVRMEDIDAARTMRGADDRILADLERFGFEWDGAVERQSDKHERYRAVLDDLIRMGVVYPCSCSRREIQAGGLLGVDGYRYSGRCRSGISDTGRSLAWRLRVPDKEIGFVDAIQGVQTQNIERDVGDFVLLRADSVWAYQLVVVVDDAFQGVNQVVRGADLLDSTPRQIFLQQLLGYPMPAYMHIPVIANASGEKLSKQTLAPALLAGREVEQLWQALSLLWQGPPVELLGADLRSLWRWAVAHWSIASIPGKRAISVVIDPNNQFRFLESWK